MDLSEHIAVAFQKKFFKEKEGMHLLLCTQFNIFYVILELIII